MAAGVSAEGATHDVAHETLLLLQALQEATAGWHAGNASDGNAEPAACRSCPLCQLLAAVHRVRPETLASMADAAASMTAALSALVADLSARGPDSTPPADPQAPPHEPHDIQRIDITD